MERNYDKVEQSNGGKNMRFFEYLKKQEPSKENEEASTYACTWFTNNIKVHV